jgi:antibiotic biosynthesis monooxygenase (ABM) superfamily enzyme
MTDRSAVAAASAGVTVVTQTRVQPGQDAGFARWQDETRGVVAAVPGFIEQSVMPPSPPVQMDWVILQRFTTTDAAQSWLHSEQRLQLLQEAQHLLVGNDDIHLVTDSNAGARPAPVSAVISTRIKPGKEAAYRRWEQRIAAAQARATGFQGYRFEPPIPGVQEDWLSIMRFDTEANLEIWLASPARHKLLAEASDFTDEVHLRLAHTGFDPWVSRGGGAAGRAPAWKQNMVVLALLYPVVFLFGAWVQTPLLMHRAGLPFWLTLFIGNIAGVLILNWLVPWTSRRLAWWLQASNTVTDRINIAGTALLLGIYAVSLAAFGLLF